MVASVFASSAAQSALQTLPSTNRELKTVGNQLLTGKKVASATLGVASAAADSIGSLLTEIRSKIVSASQTGADTATLNSEISSLRDQITSIVDAAQFNGTNLIDGSATSFDVMGSLNRDSGGNVTTGQISLNTAVSNLTATSGLELDDFNDGGGSAVAVTGSTTGSDQSTFAGGFDNTGYQVIQSTGTLKVSVGGVTAGSGGGAATLSEATASELTDQGNLLAGDMASVSIGSVRGVYTVREDDSASDIAAGVRASLIDAGIDTGVFDVSAGGAALTVTNNGSVEARVEVDVQRGSGGLSGLQSIDVSTTGSAATALGTIDSLIQIATDAQSVIGNAERRLEIQQEFTSNMIDSVRAGIGALVDADLEETAARMQALQVQQELSRTALSIANQGPQNILALFR